MRTITLDDELAALLERDKPLEQATREMLVMGLFRNGKISTGKACELLGLERMTFVSRAAELGAPNAPDRSSGTGSQGGGQRRGGCRGGDRRGPGGGPRNAGGGSAETS